MHGLRQECDTIRRCIGSHNQTMHILSTSECPSHKMDIMCIDLLSLERWNDGFETILVDTDHLQRYAQAFLTKNQDDSMSKSW